MWLYYGFNITSLESGKDEKTIRLYYGVNVSSLESGKDVQPCDFIMVSISPV
jgi:hypothetical protein